MTMRFKKRSRKNSGRRTHGFGNCQGHRKTGHKAGHGLTNTWQKGMKSYALKQRALGYPKKFGKNRESPWIFGKHGFKRPEKIIRVSKVNYINLGTLNTKIDSWVEKKLAVKEGNIYTVNLQDVNFQKILARGNLDKKINVTVRQASKYAIEEIENAGGKVILVEN